MCQRWQELRIERGKVVMIKIAQVAPVLAPLMPQLEHVALGCIEGVDGEADERRERLEERERGVAVRPGGPISQSKRINPVLRRSSGSMLG